MTKRKIKYFDDLSMEELLPPGEFDGVADTDDIVEIMVEKTWERLEAQTDFMEKYSNPMWALMRLDYLSLSEDEKLYMMLVELYHEEKLVAHLMDVQERASNFIKTEKPRMMKAWNVESEEDPKYQTMMSALREMTIKSIVEAD